MVSPTLGNEYCGESSDTAFVIHYYDLDQVYKMFCSPIYPHQNQLVAIRVSGLI